MLKNLIKVGVVSSLAILLSGCGEDKEIINKIDDKLVSSLELSTSVDENYLRDKEIWKIVSGYEHTLNDLDKLKSHINTLSEEEKKVKLSSFNEEYSEELNEKEFNSKQLLEYFEKKINETNNFICNTVKSGSYEKRPTVNENKHKVMLINISKYTLPQCPTLNNVVKQNLDDDMKSKRLAKEKAEERKKAEAKAKAEAEAKKYGYSSVDEYLKAKDIYENEYLNGSKYGSLGYFSLFSRHYHLANKYSFLTLKGSIEDYEKKQNIYKSYDNYEKLVKETAKGGFKSVNDYLVAQRTISVDRNELGRVISRPSKYLGKIIKFQDNAYDYVMEFGVRNLDDNRHKFLVMDTIKMRGANWSKNNSETVFLPIDIYNKLENDFYNKTQKNIDGYYMQTNEIELLPISGKRYNEMFGTMSSSLYIMDNQTVLLVKKIKIYNRDLGTYETKFFNY